MRKLIKRNSFLRIDTPLTHGCLLSEFTHGFNIKPAYVTMGRDGKSFYFNRIWMGDYNLVIDHKTFHINTSTDFTLTSTTFKAKNRNRFAISKKVIPIPPEFIRTRLHDRGWKTVFRNFDETISVCNYLLKEASTHTAGINCVIPIAIADIAIEDVKPQKMTHPSVIIIQNHQLEDKSKALVGFSKVIRKLPEIHFYISKGLQENRASLGYKKVIDTLKGFKNVEFVDIDASNKYQYLRGADIYVLASGLDCTPATILEASLMEKPVLASRIGGVPEMIVQGETGWTIDNNDSDLWIGHIHYLVEHREERLSMGRAAREHVLAKYNTELVASKIFKEFTR